MPLWFLVVPVSSSSLFEQGWNGFLSQHKVVFVDRQLVDQGVKSFWAICVDYLNYVRTESPSELAGSGTAEFV